MPEIIKPNTPEWFAARRGMLTASRMGDVMKVLKNGHPSKERQNVLIAIAAERLTGQAEDNYVNSAMQWGIDHEADAVNAYEIETGVLCDEAFLFVHDSIPGFGATPDRLVGTDGLVEVKCPNSTTHIEYIEGNVLPEQYAPQVYTQLAVTGRKWCDFCSYDPRMPARLRLWKTRVFAEPERIKQVEDAARKFLAEVVDKVAALLARKAA